MKLLKLKLCLFVGLSCFNPIYLVQHMQPTEDNIAVILPSGCEVRIVGSGAEELLDLLGEPQY